MKLLKNLFIKLFLKFIKKHKFDMLDQVVVAEKCYVIVARYYKEDLTLVYVLKTEDNNLFEEKEEHCKEYIVPRCEVI